MTDPAAIQAVILFSTADWFSPYWTNKQHIAARLAERGISVLYVESTGFRRPGVNWADLARMWRRFRRATRPLGEVQRNVWVVSPLTIPAAYGRHWADNLTVWQLRRR